jgi:hypothetical protein
MKKLFYLFAFLLLGSFALSSCSNDDDEVVVDPDGNIKAMVTPAGSAQNMRVTQGGSTTLEITPDGAGVFMASNLKAGDYTVTFTPALGFQAPNPQAVNVTGGNTSDLGTVTLQQGFPGSALGWLSAMVNNSPWNSLVAGATVSGTDVTITGSSVNLTSGSGDAILLTLKNVTGPGTYSGPVNATAIFSTVSPTTGSNPPTWAAFNAIVIITKFDTSAKKLSGTFTFTAMAVPTTPATGTKTITNGTFTDVIFQ